MAWRKDRRQAIIWTNTEHVHWRIYAAQGEGELMYRYGDWFVDGWVDQMTDEWILDGWINWWMDN